MRPRFVSCFALLSLVAFIRFGAVAQAESGPGEVILRETFEDPTLPAWQGVRNDKAHVTSVTGPNGNPAISMTIDAGVTRTFTRRLPIDRVAGKAVLIDVWRKADKVVTGREHYYNAKAMLSWKAKGANKPEYSGTEFSDFFGTFDWQRHRYVVNMPEDLEWAAVSIGMQACSGKASWADLTIRVDPRFRDQASLERFLAEQQRRAFESLTADSLTVKRLPGGTVQLMKDDLYVPKQYWNADARQVLLAGASESSGPSPPGLDDFASNLATAFDTRADQLHTGLSRLSDQALNDRVLEIACLRERTSQIINGADVSSQVTLTADASKTFAVAPLVFGNNVNTQNFNEIYDSRQGNFRQPFLDLFRPMGITFLRYPGGCNADIFNWKDTVGPLETRGEILNYHDGTGRGIARFGVDEFLQFCQRESITPIITTAFCKDHPQRIDPNEHPKGVRHPYVFSYLKTAPDRVQLAADWVEYCNGSVDTSFGRLRAQNGHPEPYGVKYWEVGNESYGPDPTGSCTADEYAKAFPKYVRAMKERDPSITVVMNGYSQPEWNATVLAQAGRYADAFQFHIYHSPRFQLAKSAMEARPDQFSPATRSADRIPALLYDVERIMQEQLGHTLPTIISEFGMGNTKDREFMTSVTSPVLVADMWRTLIESPLVVGANKWCLYNGYWFSQIVGPTTADPDAAFYGRPEHAMHCIYAWCRGESRLAVNNEQSDGVKAVVFQRPDSYGVVLISRESASWQSLQLGLPGIANRRAECLMMTAGHPLIGNEHDPTLIQPYRFDFHYAPDQPILVPANSVIGLVIPR
ncbi:hypothetical protein [Crateriforma spongiae]|uniref:hypothetical protein n=1 Tax=Crateriforma spongiae TaxID=2724528 RepID=UPI0014481D6D|nr:hypothetical protein [Crateriforma spongiae]